ncbi:MAG TPA: GNAT family N-acetyltransferase [Actinomycetota bacterium]
MSAGETAGVEIRPARPRDARSFLDLWTEALGEGLVRVDRPELSAAEVRRRFRRSLTADDAEFVAAAGGAVVGHLLISRERSAAARHVATLSVVVARAWRRRGIGSALLREGIAWARERGVEKLLLSVYPHNGAALALYRSFGFEEEGRLARHSRTSYGDLDEILMASWIGIDGGDAG